MIHVYQYATTFDTCYFDSQRAGGIILDVQTPQKVMIQNSRVNIANTAVLKLASPNLWISANHFVGKALLELATVGWSLKRADTSSNAFGGAQLSFGKVTHGSLQMRNNINMSYSTTSFGAFSPADEGKIIEFNGNNVKVDGVVRVLNGAAWNGPSHGNVTIKFVTPEVNGQVILENGKTFGNPAAHGTAVRCDAGAGGSGVDAGCDPRAQCHDLSEGGVSCTCKEPLPYKTGNTPDGSRCAIAGQLFHILQKETVINATVHKPMDLN